MNGRQNHTAAAQAFVNTLTSPPIIASHHVSSGQNSLQGALVNSPSTSLGVEPALRTVPSPLLLKAVTNPDGKSGSPSESLDQEMQRQLQEYNRSVTIIIWYKAYREPIRLQHMNTTFPYFQLLQLSSVITDLGLTSSSYLDAYDPHSTKWEQHTIGTVRLVATQQRLLYKIRRTLLQGLSESECVGLQEEVQNQSKASSPYPMNQKIEDQSGKKRPAPESSLVSPTTKVHISDAFYSEPTSIPTSITPSDMAAESSLIQLQPCPQPPVEQASESPAMNIPKANNSTYTYQSQNYYQTAPPTTSTLVLNSGLPPHLTSPDGVAAPIPYHPHPPLKRWPNDYTVSELTAGFNAMELLIRQPPNGVATTQRAAFERVFGSRYVKSTVCRHRAVWRKAEGSPLREQFETMGTDERACWGEFVRRIEGRGPGKAAGGNYGVGVAMTPDPQSMMVYQGLPRGPVVGVQGASDVLQSQTRLVPRRTEGDKSNVGDPVMASLGSPDDEAGTSLQNSQFA